MIAHGRRREAQQARRTRSRSSILLAMMTLVFLLATATLAPFSQIRASTQLGQGSVVTITVLVALLVCLIPTTIGGTAVGDRHRRHGPHGARQRDRDVRPRGRGRGRRRRAAARQDRHDHARRPPGDGVSSRRPASTQRELADAAQLASLADETPEGRSIVVLAKQQVSAARPRPRGHVRTRSTSSRRRRA